ncbi:MAG: hypothetical protein NVS4B12_00830 [Ktedonobacteraceae bacterium]
MPKRYPGHETDDEHGTLEERLSAYYGPVLLEEQLPASSWLRLSSQLSPRYPSRRGLRPKWRFTQRASQTLPFELEETLSRIAFQAGMSRAAQSIQCTFKARIDVPFVSVSPFKKHALRLILPTQGGLSLSQAERDVLLASGLARFKYMRQAAYVVVWLLLSALLLLPLLAIAFMLVFWRNVPTSVALSLIVGSCVLNTALIWLLGRQVRRTVRRADLLVVQWIGREQTCRGLHALAARSHTPSRSKWGELSLDERIHSICHTPNSVEDERLTLVR